MSKTVRTIEVKNLVEMTDYISKIRQKIGHDKIIHPGVRIIVENANKEILFIEKANTGQLGLPAGALEENETIRECIIREVQEETGIELLEVEVTGISSNPKIETVQYSNGDKVQYFVIEFYCKKWKGQIGVKDAKEIKSVKFMDSSNLKRLPENEKSIIESFEFFKKHNKIKVK